MTQAVAVRRDGDAFQARIFWRKAACLLEFGSPVLPRIPEAEALSLIDMLDARLFEMRDALAGVEPGGFSAKVWCLDNRELYRPARR